MKAAIVLTSINDCTELLNGYLENLAKYGREANYYLIPDRKTPKQNPPNCVRIPGLQEQVNFLEKLGFPFPEIPVDSDNRRNIGYLMALADGAEVVISIDDDNYCREGEDFVREHCDAMTDKARDSVSVEGGWYNNCDLLHAPKRIFARGFPYYVRDGYRERAHTFDIGMAPVKVNAGMWLGDPDMDAITWMHRPFKATYCSASERALAGDTWCPVNSQNTAVHRDLMPAYYFVRMVQPNDRFGDIFQGYFALKVAKHMGWTARFGSPVVDHRRNSHNYFKDAIAELPVIAMLEEFLPQLLETKLSGSTVHEAYLSLADFVESQSSKFYSDTARLMRLWANSCKVIG